MLKAIIDMNKQLTQTAISDSKTKPAMVKLALYIIMGVIYWTITYSLLLGACMN